MHVVEFSGWIQVVKAAVTLQSGTAIGAIIDNGNVIKTTAILGGRVRL
jgi:hypothetical protein